MSGCDMAPVSFSRALTGTCVRLRSLSLANDSSRSVRLALTEYVAAMSRLAAIGSPWNDIDEPDLRRNSRTMMSCSVKL